MFGLKKNDAATTVERASDTLPRVSPAVDVLENESGYVLYAEMPGATKDSVTVTIERDELSIEGRAEFAAGGEAVHTEFGPVVYHRRFRLGRELDGAGASAAVEQGILTLTIPRTAESRPRRIDVN